MELAAAIHGLKALAKTVEHRAIEVFVIRVQVVRLSTIMNLPTIKDRSLLINRDKFIQHKLDKIGRSQHEFNRIQTFVVLRSAEHAIESLRSGAPTVATGDKPRSLFGFREKFRELTQRKRQPSSLANESRNIVVNDHTNLEIIPPRGKSDTGLADLNIQIPEDDVVPSRRESGLTAPSQDDSQDISGPNNISVDLDDLDISMGKTENHSGVELNAPEPIGTANSNFRAENLDLEIGYTTPIQTSIDSNIVGDIYINPLSTRGADIDGKPGDEGLVLMVQPRDTSGRVVLAPAPVTISLIDPSLPSESQRVGFWKFTAKEIDLFLANDELADRGFLLNLPWDQNPPKTKIC